MLNPDEIKKLLEQNQIDNTKAFEILQSICVLTNQSQGDNGSSIQELILRVLDRRREFDEFDEILNGLIRHYGLYPYLNTKSLKIKDALARELHRPSLIAASEIQILENFEKDEGLVFHRVQAEIFRRILLDGESVVLSAPTSFGKSALVDALIESGRFDNVVIVVPTIALIDETRRRLFRITETHKIITHASQEIKKKNIFVLTQERAVDFPNLPENIDLFVLDEFYKLDPREDSQRAMTLNHAFYKITKKSRQFYLLGPNIQNIPKGFSEKFRCRFIKTDFATVVTELIPVRPKKNEEMEELLNLCGEIDGPTLIFCASPNKARRVVQMLSEKLNRPNVGMPDAAQWVGENYHPEWTLVRGLQSGIGMHHGRMPRALAQLCVKGFNEGLLPILVCTSTLIEGVNTKAKNVIIFDNKIARKKYDFFTFNNIRGRSGRMFKHFIGNVYVFHEPPHEELPFVEIPVFSQDSQNTSESLLIQLDEDDLQDESRKRLEPYYQQQILDIDVIRQNAGIEPRDQIALAHHLVAEGREELCRLSWTDYPKWEQLLYLCKKIWDFFIKSNGRVGGVSSGEQLAFKIKQMQRTPLKSIILQEVDKGKDPDYVVEELLEFIRQWPQYRFPKLAMVVCRIHNAVLEKLGGNLPKSDYTLFAGQVESLFSDPSLIALDEYGIPFPLAKKLENALASDGLLDKALSNLINIEMNSFDLTDFEKDLISDVKSSIMRI
ncbi:DEAD/DEAH box helicase [Ottowia massiliensis]|mgnify:FL=1|uniref:DEAD/DEAH box helicase n=1 Tax=Ottowia massiliensis TaxID=2045302 RepID=UPI000C830813|nr:DEAD/DEAH box helicase [Ottowia massiliensis]